MSFDLLGAATIAAFFLALLIIAELWARLGNPNPEWTRKLVHLGGSMIGVFLPLLVDSPLIAFVLTASLSLFFALASRQKALKSLSGVKRSSRGSEYYPLAVWLVFVIAGDDYWRYLASILVLGVADAFAALVGGQYGKIRYPVDYSTKSLEGSAVFFIVAFLAIHLPTLLLTDLPRPVVVLSSLLVALVVTGFEAISVRGADNLFVPIAVCVILGKITAKPIAEIRIQIISAVLLCILLAIATRWVHSFNVGATLALALFTYGLWSLGSPLWALPALLGLAAIVVVHARESITVLPVARTCIPIFVFLILANLMHRGRFWYAPFLAAIAVVVAIDLAAARKRFIAAAITCAAVIAAPLVVSERTAVVPAIVILVASMLAVVVSHFLAKRYPDEIRLGRAIPVLVSILAALIVAALQATGVVPGWEAVWLT